MFEEVPGLGPMYGNPAYGAMPQTPQGLEALRYLIGGITASMTGGFMKPYVPPSQSVFDAHQAAYVNSPLYKEMLAHQYGQFGAQLGATAGGFRFVQNFARQAGYTGNVPVSLSQFGYSFGSNPLGGALLGAMDPVLAGIGVTNGSYAEMANTIFSNRFMLTARNGMIDPLNVGQQHGAMAGASAMMSMLNSLTHRRDRDGNLLVSPDYAVTRGFDNGQIARMAMQMAGSGAFGNFGARMQGAAGAVDISKLNATLGDFSGGGKNANLGGQSADRVKRLTEEYKSTIDAGLEAMGALRDLIKTTDGLQERLTRLTGGDWARSASGAREAAAGLRRVNAVAQMYDLNPTALMDRMEANRGLLQDAAGVDASLRFYGVNGGGSLGLGGMAALTAATEDMIAARGLRGDPVRSEIVRRQATQAFARNYNSNAGIAAQLLADSYDKGLLSESQFNEMRRGLTGGDQGVMADTLNRLLVTRFGSKEAGRAFMQDSLAVNMMREHMSSSAGKTANEMIIAGADSEWLRREQTSAAASRRAFAKGLLQDAGLSIRPSAAGVGLTVDRVVDALNKASGDAKYGDAARAQYGALLQQGMKPEAALNAMVASLKSNAVTGKYAETIDLAVTEQAAENYEAQFMAGGLEGMQAKAGADYLIQNKAIKGRRYGEIMKMLRTGDTAGALAAVRQANGGLDPALRKLGEDVMAQAETRFNAGRDAINDQKQVERMLGVAKEGGYGSSAASGALRDIITATSTYLKGGGRTADYDALLDAVDRSEVEKIFGKDFAAEMNAALRGDDSTRQAFLEKAGRLSVAFDKQAAKVLGDAGYGSLAYDRYFGMGKYAGNDARRKAMQEGAIQKAVKWMGDSSKYGEKDRNTLAQDFMEYLSSDNETLKQLLGVRDKGGALAEVDRAYGLFDQLQLFNDKKAAFQANEKGLTDVIHDLNRKEDKANVDKLRKMAVTGSTEEDVEKFIKSAGISGDRAEGLRKAMKAKREMSDEESYLNILKERFLGDEDAQDALAAAHVAKEARAKSTSKYGGLASLLGGLDSAFDEDKIDDIYDEIEDVVSDADIASAGGIKESAVANLGKDERKYLAVSAFKSKLESGDDSEAVMNAAKEVHAIASKGMQKVTGRITLVSGDQEIPADVEFNIGSLGDNA